MKRKLCLIGLAIPLWMFSLIGSAMATYFPSSALSGPYFDPAWNYSALTGTAKYSFAWDYPVTPNVLMLEFRGDTFDLSQMNLADFSVLSPSGFAGTISNQWLSVGDNRWFKATFSPGITTTQDPIYLQVHYTLRSTDPGIQIWYQRYGLYEGATATSTGTTVPTPEPATLILLGSGLVGLFGFRKRFKK